MRSNSDCGFKVKGNVGLLLVMKFYLLLELYFMDKIITCG